MQLPMQVKEWMEDEENAKKLDLLLPRELAALDRRRA